MNAPVRILTGHAAIESKARELSPVEANAHLAIITALADAQAKHWHWSYLRDVVWKPLEAFRPRCNCGHVLRFSPWLDGLRVVKCERCGFKTLESPL